MMSRAWRFRKEQEDGIRVLQVWLDLQASSSPPSGLLRTRELAVESINLSGIKVEVGGQSLANARRAQSVCCLLPSRSHFHNHLGSFDANDMIKTGLKILKCLYIRLYSFSLPLS